MTDLELLTIRVHAEDDLVLADRDPVELEVDAMFADDDWAPFCPCGTCVHGNVTCVNRD